MPGQVVRLSAPSGDQRPRAKLFGIGSAGCNIIERAQLPTIAVSTSASDLSRSGAKRKFMIGLDRLNGLSDTSADVLTKMPEVVGHELLDLFNNTDIAFVACGLGGIAGSMGARLVTSIAHARRVMAIAIVTTPFSAESLRRRELVAKVMSSLLDSCTMVIEFDNDKLSSLAPNMPLSKTFSILNSIMMRPVEDLVATVPRNGIAALERIVGNATHGRFGLGLAKGDERVERVVNDALSSPWFDFDSGQVTAAVAAYSASNPWDKEADRIAQRLGERLPGSTVVLGSYRDSSMADRIRLSLILCRDKGLRRDR